MYPFLNRLHWAAALPLTVITWLPFFARAGPPIQWSTPVNYNNIHATNVDGIIAGDFNGDSRLDLATIDRFNTSSGVTIWLNQGNGSFAYRTNYLLGGSPKAIASGDFNNDEKFDLLIATYPGDSLTCLLGDDTGEFHIRTTSVSVNALSPGLAVGDFNGDGNLDVVLTTGTIQVFLGLGDGYFRSFTNYFGPTGGTYAAAAADLNADGRMDVVTANYSSSSMSVYPGNGDGTLATPTHYSGLPNEYHYAVVIGDFNGDGRPDIATVNQYNNSISVRLNQGNGVFGPEIRYSACSSPHSLAVADLNGDGFLDICASSSVATSYALAILPGKGDGSFTAAVTNFSGVTGLAIAGQVVILADFTGDGRPDLASVRSATKAVTIRTNLTVPEIQIEGQGQTVMLIWPDWPVFSLQTTDRLTKPVNWVLETNPPSIINGQRVLTNAIEGGPRYFRLKKL